VDIDTGTFDRSCAEQGCSAPTLCSEPFAIAEIEVMVGNDKNAVSGAIESIQSFQTEMDVENATKAYSKVTEYFLRFRPRHFDMYCKAGVECREDVLNMRAAYYDTNSLEFQKSEMSELVASTA